MGKAMNGAGSIRQRKTGKLAGKWRLQWAYDDPASGEFTPVDKTFVSQREAANYLDDLKAKIKTGQLIEDANKKKLLTLNAWFDELAGTKENKYAGRWTEDEGKPLTIATKVSRYNSNVRKRAIGEMPVQHLRVDDARAFVRELKDEKKTAATIKDVKAVLVKVMNDAIDTYEKFPNMRNPFVKVKTDRPRPRTGVALGIEEAHKAIAAQTSDSDRAMLGLFLFAGIRLAEQMAISKAQIDFENGIIVIDRAVNLGPTGEQTIGLPKGGTEENPKTRLVVMCPSLAGLLRPIMDGESELLFPAPEVDKPRMKKLVYATWRKIRKRGKLPATMTPKDGRLSHNNWIEKLMPTVSTSTRLEHMGHAVSTRGAEHKGIGVNLTNYTRHLSEAQDILRNELERVLGLNK